MPDAWEHPRRWRIRKEHGYWTVYLLHDYGGNTATYRVMTARGSQQSAIAYIDHRWTPNYRKATAV